MNILFVKEVITEIVKIHVLKINTTSVTSFSVQLILYDITRHT